MPTSVFRIILQVGDSERATDFYSRLLGTEGRQVGGGRVYFDCGPMILALLKPEGTPIPIPEYVYFAVDELAAFHTRAKDLDALSKEAVHGASAAEINGDAACKLEIARLWSAIERSVDAINRAQADAAGKAA